jgi:DNA-binding response OmpR family regulator
MADILVIDDSPTVSITLEWTLRDHGHRVFTARDGLSALNALFAHRPDLILLDIRMPHIDGIELCLMIRSSASYAHLPIIMMSGLSHARDIQRAIDAGANEYLVKPVDDKTLIAVINRHLFPQPAGSDCGG